jgi:hypothetical protein
MDPEHLAAFRLWLRGLRRTDGIMIDNMTELLAAHDHWRTIAGDMLAECAAQRARAERAEQETADARHGMTTARAERDEAQRLCSSVQAEGFSDLAWATKPHAKTTQRLCSGKRRAAFLFGYEAAARLYPEDAPSEQPDLIDTTTDATGVHHGDTSEPGEPMSEGYKPLTAEDLVGRVVRSAGHGGDHPLPRWSWVGRVFGLGSTSSTRLCERFGVDPEEMLGEYPDDGEPGGER